MRLFKRFRSITLFFNLFTSIACSLFITSCTNDPERLRSSCGAVNQEGEVVNPVDLEEGEPIVISGTARGNLVTVREKDSGDLLLVLLQGINTQENEDALEEIEDFIFSNSIDGIFFRATENCTVEQDELEELFPGQIFFPDGRSLAEELLVQGLVETNKLETECDAEKILNCFQALEFEAKDSEDG